MGLSDRSVHNTVVAFYFIFMEKMYPSGSIVFGVGGDEHFVPPAAIIDPRTGLELAYLEVCDNVDESELRQLAKNYAGLRARNEASLPVYLISTSVAKDTEPRILALSSEDQWVQIRKEDFPSFDVLSSRRIQEHAEAPKRKALSTASDFKRASHLFAFLLLVLLVFDFWHMISVTQNNLFLLLGAAVMTVLPYFSIIKVLGLELHRHKDTDGKERT